MTFADNLYVGESIKHKSERILSRMEQNKFLMEVFCITKASNPNNLYDIYNYLEFKQPYYKDKPIHILGIAGSKQEAMELVASMLISEGVVS